jgi:sucrose-6-phosphate hydrolase SacC (GH32 family)
MALWVQQNPGRVRFFTSKDLAHWEFASDLMRDWAFECMDVVFLPVDGDPDRMKAVIYDASFDYEIGRFDGRAFHTEFGPFVAGGGNFYAAQTFNQNRDARVVQIGWMRGGPNASEHYGVPYNQQMAFPCELSLRTVDGKPRLFAEPIKEIDSLVTQKTSRRDVALAEGVNPLADEQPLDLVDLEIEFDPGTAKQIAFQLAGAAMVYDATLQRLTQTGVDDQGRPVDVVVIDQLAPRDGVVKLRLLIDRLSVETFAFDGERYFAAYHAPKRSDAADAIHAHGGNAIIKNLEIRRLKSAWSNE